MSFTDTPGRVHGAWVAGEYVYVADGIGGLGVLGPGWRVYLPLVVRNGS